MRAVVRVGVLVGALSTLLAMPADASRRPIRVDGFGNWDLYEIPSDGCPGATAGSTLVDWNGYVFSGRDHPDHLTDTYCQVPVPDSLSAGTFFYADETGLRDLIGPNSNNHVTAIRYALLDRPRFDDPAANGFQWVFYRFEAGDTDTTIAALYGLEAINLGSSSYIAFDGMRLWDASIDGYDGEYFCFDDDRYLGTWSGDIGEVSPCVAGASRVFHGAFE